MSLFKPSKISIFLQARKKKESRFFTINVGYLFTYCNGMRIRDLDELNLIWSFDLKHKLIFTNTTDGSKNITHSNGDHK